VEKKPGVRTVLISVEHSLGGATLTKGATVYGNATNHIQWTVLFLSINCRYEMTAYNGEFW